MRAWLLLTLLLQLAASSTTIANPVCESVFNEVLRATQLYQNIINSEFEARHRDLDYAGVTNLEVAIRRNEYFRVHPVTNFFHLDSETQLDYINQVHNALMRLPPEIRFFNERARVTRQIAVGRPMDHPYHSNSNQDLTQAAGFFTPGDMSTTIGTTTFNGNLARTVLHEEGHAFDAAIGSVGRGTFSISTTEVWGKIHQATTWDREYYQQDTQESFAESFSRYFHSANSRKNLKAEQPLAFEFLDAIFSKFTPETPKQIQKKNDFVVYPNHFAKVEKQNYSYNAKLKSFFRENMKTGLWLKTTQVPLAVRLFLTDLVRLSPHEQSRLQYHPKLEFFHEPSTDTYYSHYYINNEKLFRIRRVTPFELQWANKLKRLDDKIYSRLQWKMEKMQAMDPATQVLYYFKNTSSGYYFTTESPTPPRKTLFELKQKFL